MKRKFEECRFCNKETIHLVTMKMGHHKENYYQRRNIKHCTNCNKRTVHNFNHNIKRNEYVKSPK